MADTARPGTDQYGREVWDELHNNRQAIDIEHVGVSLRSSRSGTCQVELIEPPTCVTGDGRIPGPGVRVDY